MKLQRQPGRESFDVASGRAESPLGSPLAGQLSRRPFQPLKPREWEAPDEETLACTPPRSPIRPIQSAKDVAEAAKAAAEAAAESADLLQPFYSAITGGLVSWHSDADCGLVLERRAVVTAIGKGRKLVTVVRKIWPWSPAFSSGAVAVQDILVSINGEALDAHDVAHVREMLRGEEGSTVILETLRVGPSL